MEIRRRNLFGSRQPRKDGIWRYGLVSLCHGAVDELIQQSLMHERCHAVFRKRTDRDTHEMIPR